MVGRGRDRRGDRRDGREQERESFGRGGNATKYQMREKLVDIGDDFWIENDRGERAFKVDGKAVRVRNTLVLKDASGREVAKIQERIARVRDTLEIEGPDSSTLATVHKAMITPLRERFSVKLPVGEDLEVQGNIVDHEYEITAGRTKVAEVSKRWFRVRDTYGVEIAPGQDDGLILAITVGIDQL